MKEDVCRVHGAMNEENAYKCNLPNGGYRLRCKECSKERRVKSYYNNQEKNIAAAGQWKKENRERVNEQIRLDRIENPEKYKKWNQDYKNRNKERVNTLEICRQKGITIERYREMQEIQQDKCAICNQEETRKSRKDGEPTRLSVDHDHETGYVRELLCHDCNTGIGKFKDTPELLLAAADYLIKHKGTIIYDE